MPTSILDQFTMAGIRSQLRDSVVTGVRSLMPLIGKHIDSWGKDPYVGFDDFEIGVSTDPVTSTKTSALQDNEICFFVRMKEIFAMDKSLPDETKPRVLLLPIVLSFSFNLKPTYMARLWEVYTPRWEAGGSMILLSKTHPDIIQTVSTDLLMCINSALAEVTPPSQLQTQPVLEQLMPVESEVAQTLPSKSMVEEE